MNILLPSSGLMEAHWYLSTSPHGVTTQKTNSDTFTAVRTSDLIKEFLCA
jgi:hypothetical protein